MENEKKSPKNIIMTIVKIALPIIISIALVAGVWFAMSGKIDSLEKKIKNNTSQINDMSNKIKAMETKEMETEEASMKPSEAIEKAVEAITQRAAADPTIVQAEDGSLSPQKFEQLLAVDTNIMPTKSTGQWSVSQDSDGTSLMVTFTPTNSSNKPNTFKVSVMNGQLVVNETTSASALDPSNVIIDTPAQTTPNIQTSPTQGTVTNNNTQNNSQVVPSQGMTYPQTQTETQPINNGQPSL